MKSQAIRERSENCIQTSWYSLHLSAGECVLTAISAHRSYGYKSPSAQSFDCHVTRYRFSSYDSTSAQLVFSVDATPPNLKSITNNCPLPSRIFHGRQIILDRMHSYFLQDFGKQKIFLLHGLGGAGKTQIALKFIAKYSSR